MKRLRLLKRSQSGCSIASIAGYASLLEKSRGSNDAMSLLLRIADALGDQSAGDENTVLQQEDLNDTVRRLAEHFGNERESAARAKILSLIGVVGTLPGQDPQVDTKNLH
jgi:fatty acid-binding protein DegV